MPSAYKSCSTCRLSLPQESFSKSAKSRDGLQGNCRDCSRRYRQSWVEKNRAAHNRAQLEWATRNPEAKKNHRLRWKYGITLAEFEEMSERQEGKCLICADLPERLVVDHDHATGAVRGLLCSPCNIGIGHLKDDPVRLVAAAQYLREQVTGAEPMQSAV